jgi:hypothetical protein
MLPADLLQRILFFFGVGFFFANVKVILDLVLFQVRKRSAILVWENPKPPYYGFTLALGAMLGLLLSFKLFVQHRQLPTVFGEAMMFVYYGYTFPLATRILRGFYRDGVWSDTGFVNWGQISAVSWKEEEGKVILLLVSHSRSIARRLQVPGPMYGPTRKLLRDKIKAHDIHIGGSGLDLGSRDDEDAV